MAKSAGMTSEKALLLEQTCRELRARLETLGRAAREAHEAATDPGSRAESKYDTRSLEASYLASGQAKQLADMAEVLRVLESWELTDLEDWQEIEPGALVEANLGGGKVRFLLVPLGGGMEVQDAHGEVTLLSPDSPLYQKLLGMRVGDELDQPPLEVCRVS